MADFVGVAVKDRRIRSPVVVSTSKGIRSKKSYADTVKGIEACSAGERSEKKLISISVSIVGGESGWIYAQNKLDLARRWVELSEQIEG